MGPEQIGRNFIKKIAQWLRWFLMAYLFDNIGEKYQEY